VAKVVRLDVRVDGGFEIAAAGLPHTSRGTYIEIREHERLAYLARVDFIPDADAFDRLDVVELESIPGGTRMRFVTEKMHSEHWQQMAEAGWRSSLEKLQAALDGGA
jgi:hypothetical protein